MPTKGKGKGESGVKYVKNNFLKTTDTPDLKVAWRPESAA